MKALSRVTAERLTPYEDKLLVSRDHAVTFWAHMPHIETRKNSHHSSAFVRWWCTISSFQI